MRQNRNFNFKAVSSTNEKMLIILSWIIVVIIVVLIGLYYGQQVRENDAAVAKIETKPGAGEVTSNPDSHIEEGEIKASKEAGSVLTDTMSLNKNELFTIQIGSTGDGEFYDEEKASEIIREFSDKSLFTRKVVVSPDKRQYVINIGLFKNYEEAKTMLNAVKLKNYPAKIAITPDPNAEIAYIPKAQDGGRGSAEIAVVTADSKLVNSITAGAGKTAVPEKKAEEKPVVTATETAKLPDPKAAADAPKPVEPEKRPDEKPLAAAIPADSKKTPDETAATDTKAADAKDAVEKTPAGEKAMTVPPAEKPATAPDAGKTEAKDTKKPDAKDAKKVDAKSKITEEAAAEIAKAASAKPAEATAVSVKKAADAKKDEVKTDEIRPDELKAEETKAADAKKDPKKTAAAKKPAPPKKEEEITAGDETASEEEITPDEADSPKTAAKGDGPKKGGFYIQLGTYKSRGNADTLKAKVAKLGYSNASIVPGKASSGDTVYRVRLEGYASKDEASGEATKIKSEMPEISSPYISK